MIGGVSRARIALCAVAVVGVAARASELRAQSDWVVMTGDTAHVREVALTKSSLVWVESRGLPPGAMLRAVGTTEGGPSIEIPAVGAYLSKGTHRIAFSLVGEFLPESASVRVRVAPVASAAGRDSVLAIALDAPTTWNGTRTYRLAIPEAGSVAVVTTGFSPAISWRFASGEPRAQGQVVQIPGPTELLAEVAGDVAGASGAAVAFRAFASVDDLEPNDDPAFAAQVAPDEWITISFGHPGDVDHLTVNVPTRGALSVEWGIVPPGIAPAGVIITDAGEEVPAPAVVDSGSHLVRVSAGDRWSPEAVTARLRFTSDVGASVTPGLGGAATMTFDRPVRLRLGKPHYTDSVSFVVTTRGTLELHPETGDPTLQPTVSLRRADGYTQRGRHDQAILLYPSRYVAVLEYETPPPGGEASVVLRASFTRDTDSNEPNDHDSTATAIALPARIEGRIEGTTDRDMFALRLDQPGVVRIRRARASPFDSVSLFFRLRAASDSGKFVVPRTSFEEGIEVQFPTDTGTYHLTVFSPVPVTPDYELDVTFEPAKQLEASGGLAVALIGLALRDVTADYLERTALASGAVYFSAEDTAALSTAVDSASSQLVASLYEGGWRRVAAWVGLLSAAAAVAAALLLRRRRRRAAMQSDPAPPSSATAT